MPARKKKYRWTAARRRAFNKMRAALKRSRRKNPKRTTRKRRKTTTKRRTLRSLATKRRKNPMAKRRRRRTTRTRRRRRNPGALLVNPRRKRRTTRRRRRRNPGALLVNARRRRRYRRNAVGGGLGTFAFQVLIPSTVGGLAMGYLDAKFFKGFGPVMRTAVKGLVAVGAGYIVGKKLRKPRMATAMAGAMFGSIGTEWGIRAGGGIVAASKEEGAGALISAARHNPYVARSLGALLQGPTRTSARVYANELIDNEAAHYTDPDDSESEEQILREYETGMANGGLGYYSYS